MASRARVTTRGGKKFNEVLKQAKRNKGRVVEVGVHADAPPYPDRVEVALVATVTEFGLSDHVEKPWFRSAVIEIRDELKKKKVRTLARGGGLSDADATMIAELAVDRIKASIRTFNLIDTGRLLNSIKGRVKHL